MGTGWTAWHFFFGCLLRRRGPRGIEVFDEVRLSAEPVRLDYLIVRKPAALSAADADEAQSLRRLWPLLPHISILEYKSPARPYRRADLDRLWGYVHLYFANGGPISPPREESASTPSGLTDAPPSAERRSPGASEVDAREDLCAVLIVPKRTPTLDRDLASMGLRWEDCGAGYWRVHEGLFDLKVVELDVAGPADGDEVLYSLGHGKATTPEARRFWLELAGSKEAQMSVQEMEGYDELIDKVLDTLPAQKVLAHYKPEQVLAHYKPEERLADLDRDHTALALPIDVLRALSAEYLQSLSPEVQAEIRRRLAKNGHSD